MRLALLSVFVCCAAAVGQTTQPVPSETFRSLLAGLEYAPPPGGVPDDHPSAEFLARYTYANGAEVRIRRMELSKDIRLSDVPNGVMPGGLLETSAEQLMQDNPSAELLARKLTSIGDTQVGKAAGLIVARYNAGADRLFSQQAIFGVEYKGLLKDYFLIQMLSPTFDKDTDKDKIESVEAPARRAFMGSLHSIKLIDRQLLLDRSEKALPRALGFFVQAHKQRIIDTLEPRHFERIVRDGKDIGYTQIDERVITRNGNEGIEITVRSLVHTGGQPTSDQEKAKVVPQANNTDTYFMSFDRDHEIWSKALLLNNGSQPQVELGGSDRLSRLLPDKVKMAQVGPAAGSELPMKEWETTDLDIRPRRGKEIKLQTEPKHYLSQALGQLLVRLISRDPGEYEFSFYCGDTGKVMARWVTVDRARMVKVGDTEIMAIPIIDRIGFEGPPTTHYVTPAGDWLGTVTADNHVQVLPTDAEELEQKMKWEHFAVLPIPPVPADPVKVVPKKDEAKVRPRGTISR